MTQTQTQTQTQTIQFFVCQEDWAGGSRSGVFAFNGEEVRHIMGDYPNGWEENVREAATNSYSGFSNGRHATVSYYSQAVRPAESSVIAEAMNHHGVSAPEELWKLENLFAVDVDEDGVEDLDNGVEISERQLEEYVLKSVKCLLDFDKTARVVVHHRSTRPDESMGKCQETSLLIKWVKGTGHTYVSINGKCMTFAKMTQLIKGHVDRFLATHRGWKRGLELGDETGIFQVIGFSF